MASDKRPLTGGGRPRRAGPAGARWTNRRLCKARSGAVPVRHLAEVLGGPGRASARLEDGPAGPGARGVALGAHQRGGRRVGRPGAPRTPPSNRPVAAYRAACSCRSRARTSARPRSSLIRDRGCSAPPGAAPKPARPGRARRLGQRGQALGDRVALVGQGPASVSTGASTTLDPGRTGRSSWVDPGQGVQLVGGQRARPRVAETSRIWSVRARAGRLVADLETRLYAMLLRTSSVSSWSPIARGDRQGLAGAPVRPHRASLRRSSGHGPSVTRLPGPDLAGGRRLRQVLHAPARRGSSASGQVADQAIEDGPARGCAAGPARTGLSCCSGPRPGPRCAIWPPSPIPAPRAQRGPFPAKLSDAAR